MVEAWLAIGGVGCALIAAHFWVFFEQRQMKYDLESQLDEMAQGLAVVASVLERLPEMVPQFSINQNPLTQILEAWQQMVQSREASYSDRALRDDTGRFTDGKTQEENN